ncbi:MAG TPA: ribosome biogenesis GTPase Der [Miltoncostaeaceae bacterium]|nr:ribosome biogenesis GTPase Der [Miltoncostaeaceae bacterium]
MTTDEPGRAPGARRPPRRRRSPTPVTVAEGQPTVVIVGYPNVGKSTLFNRLTGRRDAVVDPVPGVTRDRRQAGAEWGGRQFQLVDTGGIDGGDAAPMARQVTAQAVRALDEADLVLFVVDATVAPTAGDLEVADRLRAADLPVIVVANKVERPETDLLAQNLWSLGLGDVHAVSAQHGLGTGDLLDAVVAALPPEEETLERPEGVPAVCIMGRANVGKSSILNALLGEERVIVHDRPGTTRDPIDTLVEVDGRQVVLTDTAGLRRRGRMREDVEHYAQLRALEAAQRSDVALVVADATEGITDADLRALDEAARAHCATILVMNKWDLAQPDLDHLRGLLRAKSRQRPTIEVCSAHTGEGLHRLLPAALRLHAKYTRRLPTRELNDLIRALAEERPGPRRGRTRLSLRYLVQISEAPPVLRLDVNDRTLMTRDYGFWLENRIRQRFDLDGVPIVLQVRDRGS